jgi:hypothetical protein
VFHALLFAAALRLPLTIQKSKDEPVAETELAFAEVMSE